MMSTKPRYELVQELAKGSASTINQVRDLHLLRDVAQKVLCPESRDYPEVLARFREEAQVTAQLEHPNIVPLYDWEEDESGGLSFTMKFIRGGTLRDELQEEQYDPGSEAELYRFLQIFLKVCDGLSFAHSKGVIHRDLKPENIMVGDYGQVYLMDWGVLKLLRREQASEQIASEQQSDVEPLSPQADRGVHVERDLQKTIDLPGMVLGSLSYLSPEQAAGKIEQMDERTDVFALGAILYEILTKSPPYFAWSIEEFLERACNCEIVPPQEKVSDVHLPAELCRIAMKAMSKRKEDRYPSVDELKHDVELFLQGGGRFDREIYAPGDVIIKEGDEGSVAYLIVRGQCKVTKKIDGRDVVIGRIGPGNAFGETAVFASSNRTATVAAIDEVTVKVINREELEQELGFNSWIRRLVRATALRFVTAEKRAIQRQKHLNISLTLNHLLLLLSRHNESDASGVLKAPWSVIYPTLCGALSCSEEDLFQQLLDWDGITLTREAILLDTARVKTILARLASTL